MNANESWIDMIRRVPANLHDSLALGLATGSEIVVQKIVKLNPEFMILRGRLAGTQDNGRIVVVPYGQLTFVAIQQHLQDAEVQAIFGQGAPVGVAAMAPLTVAETTPEVITVNDEPAAVNPPKKAEALSKAMLLSKLRERLKESGTIK